MKRKYKILILLSFLLVLIYIFWNLLSLFGLTKNLDRKLAELRFGKIVTRKLNLSNEECLRSGGILKKGLLTMEEQCLVLAKDAGKTCLSGFQCSLGICEYNDFAVREGKCAEYVRDHRCTHDLHFGQPSGSVC